MEQENGKVLEDLGGFDFREREKWGIEDLIVTASFQSERKEGRVWEFKMVRCF